MGMNFNPTKNKRELILAAGIRTFSQKGYHNAKMEEIAVVAGIGKGTIYEYFSSKLHLFQEITENSLQYYYESISPEEMRQMTVEARIEIIMQGHIRFCQQNKDLSRILFWDSEMIDEELRDWFYRKRKEKETVLQRIIEEGIRCNELRQVDARLVTLMIGGMLSQIWLPITVEGWDIDAAATAKQVTDLIMHGLKNGK
jgi:AcrR family transcriptional regulator